MARVVLQEAVKELNRSVRTLKRWVEQGCPHDREGPRGRLRICPDEAREWRVLRREQNRTRRRKAFKQANAGVQVDAVPPVEAERERKQVPSPASPPAPAPAAAPTPTRTPSPMSLPASVAEAEVEDDASDFPQPDRAADGPQPRPVRPPRPADLLPPDLRLAVALNRVLGQARSVSVTRIPTEPGEPVLWGDLNTIEGISFTELKQAVSTGGLELFVERHYGPGRYKLKWIGPAGTTLTESEIEIQSLEREARRLRLEDERIAEEQRAAERAKKERLQAEEKAAKEARLRERKQLEQLRAQLSSVRVHADVGVREGVRRVRWSQALVQYQIVAVTRSKAREEARLTRAARLADQAVERLYRARDELWVVRSGASEESLESLRGRYGPRYHEPFRVQREPASVDLLAPLEAELARLQAYDFDALREDLQEFLEERAGDLFPAPVLDPVVVLAVEHLLPPIPGAGFVPWLAWELVPPPRPPRQARPVAGAPGSART